MKKIAFIFGIVLIMTFSLFVLSAHASQQFMSEDDARYFLSFIYNYNYSYDDLKDDENFKMLTGTLEDDIDVNAVKISFLTTMQAQINNNIDNASYNCDILRSDLQNYLEEKAAGMTDLPEQEYNTFLNNQLGILEDALVDWLCSVVATKAGIYVTENILDNIKLVSSCYSDLVGAPQKAIEYADYVINGVKAAMLPINEELTGRYSYFSVYLTNRKVYSDDATFDIIMDYNKSAIIESYPLGTIDWYIGSKDSWIEHIDDIERWADVTIQVEKSIINTKSVFTAIITFNSNCDEVEDYSYTYDANKDNWIDDYEMSRAGYIFMGWYWDKACTDSAMGETVTIDRDLTFYAKWKQQYDYTVYNGTAAITDLLCYKVISGQTITDLTLPDSIDGYTVTRIEEDAFRKYKEITSISIPDTVTYIGDHAFSYCDALQNIYLGKNVSDVDFDRLFWGNDNLKSINISDENQVFSSESGVVFNKDKSNLIRCPYGKEGIYKIPNTVKRINAHAFGSCKKLTYVIIPDTIEVIEESTFVCCEGIEKIIIPDSITSIEESAFDRCKNLKEIVLSNNLISIGDYAFSECISLNDVVIPNSVTTLGEELFYDCSTLKDVVLSDNITTIPIGLVDRCTSLTKLRIPDKVKKLEDGALACCFNLEEIILPRSLEKVGDWVFGLNDNLKTVYYTGTQIEWDEIEFGEGDGIKTIVYYNYGQSNISPVEITKKVDSTVYVQCSDTSVIDAKVYLAVYDNAGRLLQLKKSDLTENIELNDVTEGVQYKVFIWKDFEPFCLPAEARRVYL